MIYSPAAKYPSDYTACWKSLFPVRLLWAKEYKYRDFSPLQSEMHIIIAALALFVYDPISNINEERATTRTPGVVWSSYNFYPIYDFYHKWKDGYRLMCWGTNLLFQHDNIYMNYIQISRDNRLSGRWRRVIFVAIAWSPRDLIHRVLGEWCTGELRHHIMTACWLS